MSSVASCASDSVRAFEALIEALGSTSRFSKVVDLDSAQHELGRLNTWIAEADALGQYTSSLEYKLRIAGRIENDVKQLLHDLKKLLEDGMYIPSRRFLLHF